MQAVILAGGFGSRLSEETRVKPKPMVEIGDRPILWHIMKSYSCHGINDFVICLGYKGWMIKEYFAGYFLRHTDVTIDLRSDKLEVHNNHSEPWKVTLIDTGLNTFTGGRIKRIAPFLEGETFCFTYGDGLCDVDFDELLKFHRERKVLATMTAVQPPGRFGTFELSDDDAHVTRFREKADGGWINGGFFILEPGVIDYIGGDDSWWEREPMQNLARDGQLAAYKHEGFWHCMDHLSDKIKLEALWDEGHPPWKNW
jgi:glucose-1-phosphate cytidylyltransferase